MPELTDLEGGEPPVGDEAVLDDRRRPARPDSVSPHLIPLLRNPAGDTAPPPDPEEATADYHDDLGPARGILVGIALSVPLWTILILLIRWGIR